MWQTARSDHMLCKPIAIPRATQDPATQWQRNPLVLAMRMVSITQGGLYSVLIVMEAHIVENCYYLNGFPVGHKLHGKNVKPKNKRPAAYTAKKDTVPEHDTKPNKSPTFATEEYNQLIALLHNRLSNFPLANATGIVTSTCNLS